MTYRMTDALTDAVAEIERLQERVGELCDALSIASDHTQMLEQSDQRRKKLLGKAFLFIWDRMQGGCEDALDVLLAEEIQGELGGDQLTGEQFVARIRAELKPELSKAERGGIVAEHEAGDL